MRPVSDEWTKAVVENSHRPFGEGVTKVPESAEELSRLLEAVQSGTTYDTFSKTPVHVDAFANLDRLCYWEPGRYELKMTVETSRPERTFSRRWH